MIQHEINILYLNPRKRIYNLSFPYEKITAHLKYLNKCNKTSVCD